MFVILVLLTYRHSSHGSFLFPVVHTGERIIELSHRRLLDKSCRGRALHFGHELPQPADSAQEMHEGFWRCNRSKGRDSDVGGESSPEDGMPLDGRRGSFMDSHGNSRGGIGRDERRKGGKQTGAFRPASAPPVLCAICICAHVCRHFGVHVQLIQARTHPCELSSPLDSSYCTLSRARTQTQAYACAFCVCILITT